MGKMVTKTDCVIHICIFHFTPRCVPTTQSICVIEKKGFLSRVSHAQSFIALQRAECVNRSSS